MKMMWRMICVGVLLLCGCYHTLELVNIDYYSVGKTNWAPKKFGRIFIDAQTSTVSSKRFEGEFVKALEARTEGQVRNDSFLVKKNADDLTLSFTVREVLDGKMSNFAISWPGYIIFTPAWYGYGYVAQYKVNVEIYVGDSPAPVQSLFIPINLEMRHADFGRTWAATGFGWISNLFPLINGFYCTTYDTDITNDFYRQAFGRIAEYAADEVIREIRKIDFAAAAAEQTVVATKVKEVGEVGKGCATKEVIGEVVRQAVKQGAKEKLYNIDVCYGKNYRDGAPQDEAIKKTRKAAWGKDAEAQFDLGCYYYDGKGVEQSYEKAVNWWRKAAEKGYALAQYNLGVCYRKGQGVEQSYTEAVKWYRKAAEQGDAEAQYFLGLYYKDGEAVEKSEVDAAKWLRKAADQGHTGAQCLLGAFYKTGNGVEQSNVEAVKWFRKAAEQGNAEAQFFLGGCYEFGEGVVKSESEAVKWWRKAAGQGNKNAKKALERLSR